MSVISMRNISADRVPKRKTKTINVTVDEMPERTVHLIRNNRERDKLIKQCERYIRASTEYKDYIALLKNEYNMVHCAILPAVTKGEGKKYSVEIHHEPFPLYDIVDLEILRREEQNEPLNTLDIAESVMELHYAGLVGLIPLSKTQHELVDSHKVFIPLQHIFFDYAKLYEHYQYIIETKAEHIQKKLALKVQLSMQCGDLQSEAANPEFVYLNINEGTPLPEVKEEWLETISTNRGTMAKEEKEKEKAEKQMKKAAKAKVEPETVESGE